MSLIQLLLFILLIGHPGAGVKIEAEPTVRIKAEPAVKIESSIIDLTNQERVKAGLIPLEENSLLTTSANLKACDMRDNNYWSHVSPDGTQPWSFFDNVGYTYRFAGENLCRDSNNINCIRLWMASKLHRENILDSNFKEIGIGKCGVFTVQHFGTR